MQWRLRHVAKYQKKLKISHDTSGVSVGEMSPANTSTLQAVADEEIPIPPAEKKSVSSSAPDIRSFDHKVSKSHRSTEFAEETYLPENSSVIPVDESVAVNVDERDQWLGRNVHNNSLLTNDSAENNHVFDFDSSDECEGFDVQKSTTSLPTDPVTVSSSAGEIAPSSNPEVETPMQAPVPTAQDPVAKEGEMPVSEGSVHSMNDSETMHEKAVECKSALSELTEATKKALKCYDDLKQLRYRSTQHDTSGAGSSSGDNDELLIAKSAETPRFLGDTPRLDTDADMVLYEFETSFVSLVNSVAGMIDHGSVHVSGNTQSSSVMSSAFFGHGGSALDSSKTPSMVSSIDAVSSISSHPGHGGGYIPPFSRRPVASQIPATISELGDSSPIKAMKVQEDDEDSIIPSTVTALSEALDAQKHQEMQLRSSGPHPLDKAQKNETLMESSPPLGSLNVSTSGTESTQSLSQPNELASPFSAAGGTQDQEDAMMAKFLDKYSDKLVDLLSDKIKAKLSSDK